MEKSIKITLIIAATVLLLGILGFAAFNSVANPSNTLTAQGTSTIKVVPDVIAVSFNVQTMSKSAEAAKDNNSVIVSQLTSKLVAAGFNADDLKTESYNIYPEYDWSDGTSRLKGYTVQHNLRLEIPSDESESVGRAIDAGVDSGALISYINFELSNDLENQYKIEALEKATLDARAKAEAITKGLGKSIGDVVSVSTSDFNYYPWATYRLMDAGSTTSQESYAAAKEAIGTDINPGEREVTASVSVTFRVR